MIDITISSTSQDLEGIIKLQKKNLRHDLTETEIKEQGFVTVAHQLEDLTKMHEFEKNIIAKNGDEVIAYVIGMTEQSKNDIPVLVDMYESFDHLQYDGKPVSAYRYIVVGQVCVDKAYRGQGIFDSIYQAYKTHFNGRFDFAITEVAAINFRSARAHKRVGFKEIGRTTDSNGIDWSIVLWDWRK